MIREQFRVVINRCEKISLGRVDNQPHIKSKPFQGRGHCRGVIGWIGEFRGVGIGPVANDQRHTAFSRNTCAAEGSECKHKQEDKSRHRHSPAMLQANVRRGQNAGSVGPCWGANYARYVCCTITRDVQNAPDEKVGGTCHCDGPDYSAFGAFRSAMKRSNSSWSLARRSLVRWSWKAFCSSSSWRRSASRRSSCSFL